MRLHQRLVDLPLIQYDVSAWLKGEAVQNVEGRRAYVDVKNKGNFNIFSHFANKKIQTNKNGKEPNEPKRTSDTILSYSM